MPIFHITDLYNPPGDPDDHFDLLALFSIKELDIVGVLIDRTVEKGVPGIPTIAKASALAGRKPVPCVAGLPYPLRSETDTGDDGSAADQAGVEMILSALDRSADRSLIFTLVGSMRDLAAAYNREPALFHAKTRRLMVNGGDSLGEVGPRDWNTNLDLDAWRRIMGSSLPIDWFPCNPSKGRGQPNGYVTWWGFSQSEFLAGCPAAVRGFFDSEGIRTDDPVWRHMWSPASFLEAAVLEGVPGYEGAAGAYEMLPVRISIAENGTALWSPGPAGTSTRIFHTPYLPAYEAAMRRFLGAQFAKLG